MCGYRWNAITDSDIFSHGAWTVECFMTERTFCQSSVALIYPGWHAVCWIRSDIVRSYILQ